MHLEVASPLPSFHRLRNEGLSSLAHFTHLLLDSTIEQIFNEHQLCAGLSTGAADTVVGKTDKVLASPGSTSSWWRQTTNK